MSKKITPPADTLLLDLVKIHVPIELLKYFDLYEIINRSDCYELILHEKESLFPAVLANKKVVLDGFCNPVSVLSHTFSLKKMYLIFKRRRWKEENGIEHFSNDYKTHTEGIKITPQYAAFLKEYDRV